MKPHWLVILAPIATPIGCNAVIGNEDPHRVEADSGVDSSVVLGDASGGRGGAGGNAGTSTGGASGGAAGDGGAATAGAAGRGGAGTGGAPMDASTRDVDGSGGSSTGGAGAGGGGGSTAGNAGAAGASVDGSAGGDVSSGGTAGNGGAAGGGTGGSVGGTGGTAGAAEGGVMDVANDVRATCESRTTSDTDGFFVEGGGTDASTCGGRANPCATIRWALERAQTGGRHNVYVASGVYHEAIDLKVGVRVEGAWTATGSTWTPNCGVPMPNGAVTIVPSAGNHAVFARDLNGTAKLAWLTVRTKPTADTSESLYGVFVQGSQAPTRVKLENVKVVAERGGDGGVGTPGVDGASGAASGCDSAEDGSSGAPANDGTGAPAGTFGQDGYVPTGGLAGTNGAAGKNGIAGMAADCNYCAELCQPIGGGEPCEPANSTLTCGSPGKVGCGGGLGTGGGGSSGGGSSVGVFLWNADLEVVDSSIAASDAGKGAAGALGGQIGGGSAGVAGSALPGCITACGGFGQTCTRTIVTLAGGKAGGTGGNGSAGGRGGGGSGGSSYAVYLGGTAMIFPSGSNELLFGNAGVSDGNGAAGTKKDIGP